MTPDATLKRAQYMRIYRARHRKKSKLGFKPHLGLFAYQRKFEIPEEVLESRDARLTEQRSLTALLMGDPEPSRSAAARRAI